MFSQKKNLEDGQLWILIDSNVTCREYDKIYEYSIQNVICFAVLLEIRLSYLPNSKLDVPLALRK